MTGESSGQDGSSGRAWLGWGLLAIGLICAASGALPRQDAVTVARRVWPVLVFFALIKVVAELFDTAGLFEAAADRTLRWGAGRARWTYVLFIVLAIVTTAVLSLDTTAVLLTPVAVGLARRLRRRPLPFVLAVIWLANCASLLFPVANLTNLLAQERLELSTTRFVGLLLPAQAAVLLVIGGWLLIRFRADLHPEAAPVELPEPVHEHPRDGVALATAAVSTVGIAAGVTAGLAPWTCAAAALGIMIGVYALRHPARIRPRRLLGELPWSMSAFAFGLFLIVQTVVDHTRPVVASLIGDRNGGESLIGLLRTAVVTGAGSNLVNNLPAYLSVEGFAHSEQALAAVLIGTNVAPLITVWASLANLLCLQSARRRGVGLTARRLAAESAVVAPLALVAGVLALWLAHR